METKFPPLEDFTDTEPLSAKNLAEREREALGPELADALPPVAISQTFSHDAPESSDAGINDQDQLETGQKTEPEPIRIWREEWERNIQERERLGKEKNKKTIEEAREYLDKFYENYYAKQKKSVEQSREHVKNVLKKKESEASGTTWERVYKLIDISENGCKYGGRDKTRMRDILITLKNDKNAPGASY